MTKKPSEKNKAWEKDRRDRLNKTFDELAKLLPKFDPSVVWSKIEIIQKAIAFIADLEKRLEDYLAAKDPELLKEYKEFVNCLRFYQERNAQLTQLLKKAKVTLPPVVLPQLLVDKPELLPKENNVEAVGLQKPKRQRIRTKKSDPVVTEKEPQEIKEDKKESSEITSNNGSAKLMKPESIVKPTAVITAFSRETHEEHPKAPTPQLPPTPPPVPAKSLLLRIRKIRKNYQRLELIPRPTFRKCYPHPSKMLQWSIDAISHRKLPSKRRQNIVRKKQMRKRKSSKHVKVEFGSEPMREQSVSPTAAFLLSFPVVTSSMLSGKNVENAESSVSLENLNNFFTTEEYSKFCDQNTVVEEKILSPIPVCSQDKPMIIGKPMTVFTVSSITRPTSPKKTIGNVNQTVKTSGTSFESYGLNNLNSMTTTTSVCAPSVQQVNPQYSSSNSAHTPCFTSSASTQIDKSIKCEQLHTECSTTKSDAYGKFFPRYNHSATSSLRTALDNPSKVPNSSPIQQKPSLRINSPAAAPNWPIKTSTPIAKLITQQGTSSNIGCKTNVSTTKPSTAPFFSPTKNFFYDFPPQNQTTISALADPLISSTAAVKSRPIKTEFPWIPPNKTIATGTCNQSTSFTPFDLATIVGETLTSTSFTFSLTTPKSSNPTVAEAGSKSTSTSKCNQMNLFLPYEEGQYTHTFSLTKPTESQGGRDVPWKPLEKPKDTVDQIFYDCEQSKPQQKAHVNWMTSPTTDYTPASTAALPLPPIDFGNQFPGSSTNFDFTFGCRKDSYDDDNQFINWSPTKPLSADFSAAYSFENFGSNEAPPNKTVKQIFSVSQLVDQTPSHDTGSSVKKTVPKNVTHKNQPIKQSFSNTYSAESLIAKKDSTRFYNPTENVAATNTQTEYHSSTGYYFNYPNSQNCTENDYLGASTYSAPSTLKTNSIHQPAVAGVATSIIPPFDSNGTAQTTTNYFAHTISSNNNDPYDPTYFPSSNYNQTWNQAPTMKTASGNIFNQSQYGTVVEPSCQQNANVSSNLTNFNLSSICPEIDGKDGGPGGW